MSDKYVSKKKFDRTICCLREEISEGGAGAQGPQGPQGADGAPGAGGAIGYYAQFSDSTTQVVDGISVPTLWSFNTTEISNGIHVDPLDTTKIYFDYAGTYRIAFSAQLTKTTSPAAEVEMWMRLGGSDVPRSNSHYELQGNGAEVLPMVAYIVDIVNPGPSGDYVQFLFMSTDSTVRIVAKPSANPLYPDAPSVIIDVEQIAYNGPQGAQGAQGPQGAQGTSFSGSGTLNYVAKWTPDGSSLGNSLIQDNASGVSVNTAPIANTLFNVRGSGTSGTTTSLRAENSSGVAKLVVKDDGAIEIGRNASATTEETASITVTGSETNIGLALVPKGDGAITASIPNGAASGGNARGDRAIDLQISRTDQTHVASGSRSVIGGGERNTASGQYSTVSGGYTNTASAYGATVAGGNDNQATAQQSAIAGGQYNIAGAAQSVIIGGLGARTSLYGQSAKANGAFDSSTEPGDAQNSNLILRRAITGVAQTELFLDGSSTRAIMPLPAGSTAGRLWNAVVRLSAVCTTQGNGTVLAGDAFVGNYTLGIKRIGTATSLIGGAVASSEEMHDTNMSSSVVTITADDTNEALKIEFTPPSTAGTTTVIRVVATVYLTEVGY